jgi:3-oxoacyl-[acyl-carrier protein] reductase
MAQFALAGKKAVITGASGGIGCAIASRFAQEGASVVLAGRTRAKLERSLENLKLQETTGGRPQSHRIHCLDVGEMKGWEGLVKENVCLFSHHTYLLCAGSPFSASV